MMLGAVPGYIADTPAQEYAGPYPDGAIIRVVQQRAELAGSRITGIAHPRLEYAHIGIKGPVTEIYGTVIVLISVARIEQESIIYVIQGYYRINFFVG
jgi:hypothetical protein